MMPRDVDLAAAAALIAEPARAEILDSLMDGRSMSAGELAAAARRSRSATSSHLSRLVDAGFLRVERRGRQRRFQLADRRIADAVEALAAIAPPRPIRGLRDANRIAAMSHARLCYDHLAGVIGVALTEHLVNQAVLEEVVTGYALGPAAARWLARLGLDADPLRHQRRAFARACLDWSERRYHLAGALGAALAQRLFELGWIERTTPTSRALTLTARGVHQLHETLGFDPQRL